MEKRCKIFIYICSIILLLIGLVTVIGGIVLIAGFDQMNETIGPTFDRAKDNIRNMIKVINRYPGVQIFNPPNVTKSDPLIDMDFKGFVKACGVILLMFGAVICAISILGFVTTYRMSRRLTMTYLFALGIAIIIPITTVVLYTADRNTANKLIYPHFFKSLDESYGGFKYRDSVSIGWNLVMQQFNCCGIYGYTDFMLSHSFHETWGEPFHSYIHEYAVNFSIACCNSIEIVSPTAFQGPCRSKDYIHKRGCIEAFWEEADKYKPLVVTLVTITCLIQLVQIIVICNSRKFKSNKVNKIKVKTSAGK